MRALTKTNKAHFAVQQSRYHASSVLALLGYDGWKFTFQNRLENGLLLTNQYISERIAVGMNSMEKQKYLAFALCRIVTSSVMCISGRAA